MADKSLSFLPHSGNSDFIVALKIYFLILKHVKDTDEAQPVTVPVTETQLVNQIFPWAKTTAPRHLGHSGH